MNNNSKEASMPSVPSEVPIVGSIARSVMRADVAYTIIADRRKKLYIEALKVIDDLISHNKEVSITVLARALNVHKHYVYDLTARNPKLSRLLCQYEKLRRSWEGDKKSNGTGVSQRSMIKTSTFPWRDRASVQQ